MNKQSILEIFVNSELEKNELKLIPKQSGREGVDF